MTAQLLDTDLLHITSWKVGLCWDEVSDKNRICVVSICGMVCECSYITF